MTKKQVLFLQNLLANCHDWDVEDLETEILAVISREFPQIDTEEVKTVFRTFDQLSPTVKFNPLFDIENFIEVILKS